MESPPLHAVSTFQRMRTDSGLSLHSALDGRGAIRKGPGFDLSRHRSISISASTSDRLYHLALDQPTSPSVGLSWITPQPSPQSHAYPDLAVDTFTEWSAPTPPRSDSGLPAVSVDTNDDPLAAPSPEISFDEPAVTSEMSSLGFLLPTQYGSNVLESEPASYAMEGNYVPPMRSSHPQPTHGAGPIPHTASSSPALYQSRMTPSSNPEAHRHGDLAMSHPAFTTPDYRRSVNPYDMPHSAAADYPIAPSQSLPSPQQTGSAGATPMMSHYGLARSPDMYHSNVYTGPYSGAPAPPSHHHPQQQPHPQQPSTMAPQAPYPPAASMSYPPPFIGSSVNEVLAKPVGSAAAMRVLNPRPKPQCWEHGCNGRQFSTFSNLLRHQREKSGTAAKAYCPKCGAEFTRTTARNGHMAHDKCTKTGPVRGSSDGK